jgi:hypothetical protein
MTESGRARLKQVTANVTEEEREIWKKGSANEGRTVSKTIVMLMRLHFQKYYPENETKK